MRCFTVISASLAVAFITAFDPAAAQPAPGAPAAPDSGELAWKLASKQSVTFGPKYTDKLADAKDTLDGEQRSAALHPEPLHYTYFGYEFKNSRGELLESAAEKIEHHLIELCLRVPGKKTKPGTKWSEKYSLPLFVPTNVVLNQMRKRVIFGAGVESDLKAEYEALEVQELDGVPMLPYKVSVSGAKVKKPPANAKVAWSAFDYKATVWFDGQQGFIRKITYDFKAKAETDVQAGNFFFFKVQAHKATYSWDWSAEVLLPPEPGDAVNDPDLKKKVQRAIDKGRDYLLSIPKEKGFNFKFWSTYDGHPLGSGALMTLTLIKCGVKRDDPVLLESFEGMKEFSPSSCYDAALDIMAIEALVTPESEDLAFLRGEKVEKFERPLNDAQKREIQRMVTYLNDCQFSNGGFTYKPNPRNWDMSNTQYAALGLNSARRCGSEIPVATWEAVLDLGMAMQMQSGKSVKLSRKVEDDGKNARVTSATGAKARGFGYTGPNNPTGSMTTAGITVLVTAVDALRELADKGENIGKAAGKIEKAQTAIRDGLGWLTDNYSLTRNPGGGGGHGQVWHYYYLYGLERACVLTNTRWVGEHDWYREGASFLVDAQAEDGHWNEDGHFRMKVSDTCFALLFLKRGTVPPRKPVITGTGEKE